MTKLDKIKKYAEALSKASRWQHSKEAVANIATIKKNKKRKEYIYEFYCLMKIVNDLLVNHSVKVIIPGGNVVFPKAPAAKSKYPYFLIKDKLEIVDEFQICVGVDVIGESDETSAPDISFQAPGASLNPTAKDVFMIFDSKFKHKLNGKISKNEFAAVYMMIDNLECKNAEIEAKSIVKFDKLNLLYGNCIFSNGEAYKKKLKIHHRYKIKEIEFFDEGKTFNAIG